MSDDFDAIVGDIDDELDLTLYADAAELSEEVTVQILAAIEKANSISFSLAEHWVSRFLRRWSMNLTQILMGLQGFISGGATSVLFRPIA
jgi:hypothetical protein